MDKLLRIVAWRELCLETTQLALVLHDLATTTDQLMHDLAAATDRLATARQMAPETETPNSDTEE